MADKSYPAVALTREPFVTIYHPVAGFKAVLMVWDDECGCHTPWQTGFFGYATREEAEREAQSWAEAEEIAYIPGK